MIPVFSRFLAAGLLVIGLAGCSSMTAQNPSGSLRPVNAVADGGDAAIWWLLR